MRVRWSFLLLSLLLSVKFVVSETDAEKLARLVNEYRQENGKAPIPFSTALFTVADYHAKDLVTLSRPSGCNMHSWSTHPSGLWTGCCYTSDHAEAASSWGSNRYTGNGYENSYGGGGIATPEGALRGWKGSPAHNDIILNQGSSWSQSRFNPWPAMGAGIYQGYAVLWFGDVTDPQGYTTGPQTTGIPTTGVPTTGAQTTTGSLPSTSSTSGTNATVGPSEVSIIFPVDLQDLNPDDLNANEDGTGNEFPAALAAGIGSGVLVLVLILIAVVVAVVLLRRRKNSNSQPPPSADNIPAMSMNEIQMNRMNTSDSFSPSATPSNPSPGPPRPLPGASPSMPRSSPVAPQPNQFRKGSNCQAKYSGDGRFYRAVVVDTRPGQFLVRYVDFGNDTEWVPLSSLK